MTRTYNAFAHIKPNYKPSARVNYVGSIYMDKDTGETYLLIDRHFRMGWFEYTAYPVLSDEPPTTVAVTSSAAFDHPLQVEVDEWRDVIETPNYGIPWIKATLALTRIRPVEWQIDSYLGLSDYADKVACMSILIEDRTEATDDELYAAWNVLDNVTRRPSPLIAEELIQLAMYAKRVVGWEINNRNDDCAEDEEEDEIPFDGKPLVSRDIGGNVCAVGSSADMTRPVVTQWQEAGYDSFVDFVNDEFNHDWR